MDRIWPLVLTVALISCGRSSAPAGIQTRVALHSVNGCAAVQKAIQDAAVEEMRQQIESGFALAGAAGGPTPTTSAPAPAAYTKTNVQVAGVDEPDLIKTDGTRIYGLAGQKLHLARSWPPNELSSIASADVEGWPSGVFLTSTHAAVISMMPAAGPLACAGAICPVGSAACGCYGASTTKVTFLDPAALEANEELWLPGFPGHARRVGDQIYLVTHDAARWPAAVRWWPENVNGSDTAAFEAAKHSLEDSNERVIRSTPLSSWLPPSRRRVSGGATVTVPYDCSQFQIGNAPVRLGFTTISTVDLAHLDRGPSRTTILGAADLTYASQSSLYLLSRHWWWDAQDHQPWTYVHKFDISQRGGARYVASGGFDGLPVDSYSLDEHRGYLRAAVNTFAWNVDAAAGVRALQQSSWMRVLDDHLRLAASIELAAGETVQGSRFLGDSAFVVTFHRVDPLHAIDLSDPTHPRLAGKLEVPGFSTYLHPIDNDHLLAVGVDIPESGTWQDRSVQLSVFDVSDLSNPRRTAQQKVGTAWGYTESLWDPHAFNWFPEKNLLAIPFSDWTPSTATGGDWGTFSSDLRVFEVHADSIVSRGAMGMKDLYVTYGDARWSSTWSPFIRRSVMAADAAGSSFVYGFSDAGLRVAALGSLEAPLATLPFAH